MGKLEPGHPDYLQRCLEQRDPLEADAIHTVCCKKQNVSFVPVCGETTSTDGWQTFAPNGYSAS